MENLTGKEQEMKKNVPDESLNRKEPEKNGMEETGHSEFRYLFEEEGNVDPYDFVQEKADASQKSREEKQVIWDYHRWEEMNPDEEHPIRDSVRSFWEKLPFRKNGKREDEVDEILEREIMEKVSQQEIDELLENGPGAVSVPMEIPMSEEADEKAEELPMPEKTVELVEESASEEADAEAEELPVPEKKVEPVEESAPKAADAEAEESPVPEKTVEPVEESAPKAADAEAEELPMPEKMVEPVEESDPEEADEKAEELPVPQLKNEPVKHLELDATVLYQEGSGEPELRIREEAPEVLVQEAYRMLTGRGSEKKEKKEPDVPEMPVSETVEKPDEKGKPMPEKKPEENIGILKKLSGIMQENATDGAYETGEEESEPVKEPENAERKTKEKESLRKEPEVDQTYDDAREGLRQKRKVQLVRTVVCGAVTVLLTLLAVLSEIPGVADAISQAERPGVFAFLNLVGILIAGAVSLPTITVGIADSLNVKSRSGADSATAFAVLACVLQVLLVLIRNADPSSETVLIAAPVGVGILWANAWGKLLLLRRIGKNFYWISQNSLHALCVEEEGNSLRAVPCKVKRLNRFLPLSMQEDRSEKQVAKMTFPGLLVTLICAVLVLIMTSDFLQAVSAFAVGFCFTAPATALMSIGVPMSKSCRRLRKSGAVLASWEAVEKLGEVNRVTVWDVDLFPPERAVLRQIKIFGNGRVEEIVPTAEALLRENGGPISNVLNRTIRGEHKTPVAEQVEYEKGGIVGWIDGRRVMMGSRTLLERHGIDAPSREYEKQNYPEGQNVLYFVDGGELSAAFLVEYGTGDGVGDEVRLLAEYSCDFDVLTNDGSITQEWLTARFDLPEDCVTVRSGREALRSAEKEAEEAEAFAATNRTGLPVLRILSETIRLKQKANLATLLQAAGMWIGLLLLLIFCAAGALLKLNTIQFLAYELLWIAAILGISAIR